ncbi:cell division protein FtsX [Acetobacter sp.]|jgi:cell division transport system permease protein|uniref:cell division protein FtsX n=1 Tax=Acetobacter sp. TaxID=440 RepID=UPI0025B8D8B2|nr:FtsX-like permease family protein [Acetobacter sp.]MCH4090937.1 cell division protein FtsX [Acetobacter sp.]MCI1300778.1 cell division protein FtsX [Acetobacter sp.]MCI1317117.1 cell division protein FtsX [Acetobacter sp.]
MSKHTRVRDGLALSRALPDRSLLTMVAAMSLLIALTFTAAVGAQSLSERWAKGAANLITVQVPDPDKTSVTDGRPAGRTRIESVLDALKTAPDIMRLHRLDEQELDTLLKPWLGNAGTAALPLPAVIEVDLTPGGVLSDDLVSTLVTSAPDTLIEKNDDWRSQLHTVARSLLFCSGLAIALVGAIGAAVIGMATRLGLGSRRESVTILHELGASDGYVARRFASRVAFLSFLGGLAGTLVSLPPIAILTHLMAPFSGSVPTATQNGESWLSILQDSLPAFWQGAAPHSLLIGLGCIPFVVTLIGWLTAQIIVRVWLRRLP